jgi:hypothetical protein
MNNNNNNFSEKINLDDLYQRKNEVEQHRIKIYQKILTRVHVKIKVTSRTNIHNPFCFFVIPEFLVGVPRYDSATCTAYVIDKLIANGFQTKYTHPNLLFISWRHFIDKRKRMEFKKQYGFAIDGFGNAIKNKNKNEIISSNPNTMLLSKNKAISILKKPKNYKSTSTYKPGGLIYDMSLIKTITDGVTK